MRIITINLSEPHVKALALLQEIGLYPSRSEAIRVAIREFLKIECVDEKKIDDVEKIPQFLKDHLNYSGSVEDKKKEISRLIRKLQYEDQQVASAAN
ncbi:MAG: ribbon-helix-helix domain-containing protein [Promethearchaeota archaeon]